MVILQTDCHIINDFVNLFNNFKIYPSLQLVSIRDPHFSSIPREFLNDH